MKKAKNLSNKLMAALLSMAMIITTVLPGTTVYAAEPAIEAETADSEDITSENEVPDEVGTENETTDETDSGNEGSDQNGSENDGSDQTDSGNEGTDENGSDNGDSDQTGSENDGSENEDSDGTDSGNEGSDETDSEDGESSEDADAEESDEETGEEIEAEDPLEDAELLEDNGYVRSNITVSDSAVKAGGWNESLYAEITGVEPSDVAAVSWSGDTGYSGGYTREGAKATDDLDYLVRKVDGVVRIDIPGIKAGKYELTIEVGSSTIKKSNLQVYAYDRAGFAHFDTSNNKHGSGVGAYNDDGTLKDNAIVLYVTDDNKNDVELSFTDKDKKPVKVEGIGHILNSVGQDKGNNKTNNGGAANKNGGVILKLAQAGIPLVVRFIGTVSDSGLKTQGEFNAASPSLIEGLTVYNSLDNGGTVGDNGHMARIQSGMDITLEGIGYDATIDGWGFHYIAEGGYPQYGKSFEVRNLKFINTPEDAVGMEGQQANKNTSSVLTASVERCWIHNNEFYCPEIKSPAESDKSEGDGSVDFKRGQYFTCSYNYFEDCHKTNLVGSADYSLQFNLTYHHNYWYMCKARGPLTRNANVHMYNNIFDMQTDYAMNTRANAYIFSEWNMFYACKSPQAVEAGAIKSWHDSIASALWKKGSQGTVVKTKDEYVPNDCKFQAAGITYNKFDTDPTQSYIPNNAYGNEAYKVSLQEDYTKLRQRIVSQTGVLEKTPVLESAVNKDAYSVVKRHVSASDIKDVNISTGSKTLVSTDTKISKTAFAFKVDGGDFNVTFGISSASKLAGVLVNEEGQNLLEVGIGNTGSCTKLPAGTYMIQPMEFQPGDPAKGTIAVFKEIVLNSVIIEQFDTTKHYHDYQLTGSKAPTCTEEGYNDYTCISNSGNEECGERTKREPVSNLGHSWKSWETQTEATASSKGTKIRYCNRCDASETIEYELGNEPEDDNTGSGSGSGSSTVAGDYILYFESGKAVDDADFFTVNAPSKNYQTDQGSATINNVQYTESIKVNSDVSIEFDCNDDAELYMAFVTISSKNIKVDGTDYPILADDNGFSYAEVPNLSEGHHIIQKGKAGETKLLYVSVKNKTSNKVYYTLTLDYNDDDTPDPKEITVPAGTKYESAEALASAASFERNGYTLEGFYEDVECTKKVNFEYEVKGDATLYADWEVAEVKYSLIFESNGGSNVGTVMMPEGKVYYITQKSTRSGYAFAGWFNEKGNPVDKIENPTENVTVYAHWNALSGDKYSLDVAKEYGSEITSGTAEINIIQDTTRNGFKIHADANEATVNGKSTKLYMTVKHKDNDSKNDIGLYTNGVFIPDTSIHGDGLLKSIEFKTEGPGTLSVGVALSGKPTSGVTYTIIVAKKSDGALETVGSVNIKNTDIITQDFDIEEKGTYYIYADPEGDKGVYYTNINFSQAMYTLVYNTGYGNAKEKLDTEPQEAGATVELPDCTAYKGCTFLGWSVNGSAELNTTGSYKVDPDDAVNGVITVNAVYEGTPTDSGNGGGNGGGGNNDDNADTGAALEIRGLEAEYPFTGAKIIPDFYVVDPSTGEDVVLAEKIDYTVKYSDNTKAGSTASVIVTGKGNYAGKETARTFKIVEVKDNTDNLADLKGAKIKKIAPVDYNGEKQYPDFELTLKGASSSIKYTYGGDGYETDAEDAKNVNIAVSNNINKGTATILVTGSGTTKVKTTFKINAVDISKAQLTQSGAVKPSGVYAVKGATPDEDTVDLTINLGTSENPNNYTLKKGIDYTVKYSNNKKVGTAKMVFTGKGNFAKKKADATFEVTKLDMSDLNIAVSAYEGVKTDKVKATVLDTQGNPLKANQYTLSVYDEDGTTKYSKAKLTKGDKIVVVATAKDTANLVSESQVATEAFTVGANIGKAKFKLKKVNGKTLTKTYTGNEIELSKDDLEVTMKNVTGEITYDIVGYTNNIKKGTATAYIQGTGEYGGTNKVKFKIVAKTVKFAKDDSSVSSKVVNGIKNVVDVIFN